MAAGAFHPVFTLSTPSLSAAAVVVVPVVTPDTPVAAVVVLRFSARTTWLSLQGKT
jgi:hypothetical protein